MPPARSKQAEEHKGESTRIAIVNPDRCRPKKCALECRTSCPVNKTDRKCVVVGPESKRAAISERLCIGCDICVKRCPFEAIRIINLPSALDSEVTYRYGLNTFKLHRIPQPRLGQVLGLVGENGIGKSTALNILAGKLRPNFGNLKEMEPTWDVVKSHFKGSEMMTYFDRLSTEQLTVAHKIQYVDAINKTAEAAAVLSEIKTFRKARKRNPERYESVIKRLQLEGLMDRQVNQLSGGELQRFALAVVALRDATVYLIDEPSSYLDIRQRMTAGNIIRELVEDSGEKYCVVVEHDLAVLDYLSDYTSVLYGQAGVFGVISLPFSVREGINVFLSGYIPTENMRFREEALRFALVEADSAPVEPGAGGAAGAAAAGGSEKPGDAAAGPPKPAKPAKETPAEREAREAREAKAAATAAAVASGKRIISADEPEEGRGKKDDLSLGSYPSMCIRFPAATPAAVAEAAADVEDADAAPLEGVSSFQLDIEGGKFRFSQITLLLGENGTGKTTFIKAIAGHIPPATIDGNLPKLPVSIKPQTINPGFPGTVEELFRAKIPTTFNHPGFQEDVVKPLDIKHLMERKVKNISGGELQRVALVLALGKPAELYLIDEPSAYLDAAQRLSVAKIIKRFIINSKKACFVVEHDFLMALYLADQVIVFTGEPGRKAVANRPCGLLQGLNRFLAIIEITFRRDPESLRPRVNKLNSAKDREQKMNGQYFTNFTDDA